MSALGGPQAMLGWIVALVIVICDGMVWSELGAAMPGSGGSFHYLREAFGRERFGRLMGFLFVWQFVLSGPLEIASGYIGFAAYASYIWTGTDAPRRDRARHGGGADQHRAAVPAHPLDREDHRVALGRHADHGARGDRHRRDATSTQASRSTSRRGRSTSRSASSSGWARRRASGSTTTSATTTSATSATRCAIRGASSRVRSSSAPPPSPLIYIGINLSIIGGSLAGVRAGGRASGVELHRLDLHGEGLRLAQWRRSSRCWCSGRRSDRCSRCCSGTRASPSPRRRAATSSARSAGCTRRRTSPTSRCSCSARSRSWRGSSRWAR